MKSHPNFEDDHEDSEDVRIFTETAETKEKIGYTKLDLLNKLKENKGGSKLSVTCLIDGICKAAPVFANMC